MLKYDYNAIFTLNFREISFHLLGTSTLDYESEYHKTMTYNGGAVRRSNEIPGTIAEGTDEAGT